MADEQQDDSQVGKAVGALGVYAGAKYIAPLIVSAMGCPPEMAMGLFIALAHAGKSLIKNNAPEWLSRFL